MVETSSCLVRLTDSVSGRISRSQGSSGGRTLGPSVLLLGAFFQFDVQHLGFQLILELVAGALELGQEFSQLAAQLRASSWARRPPVPARKMKIMSGMPRFIGS